MRVLIVSANSFSKKYNNGKTLEAIFSKFNKDDLAQLFTHPLDGIDFDFCDNYFCISEIDIIKSILFLRRQCGNKIISNNSPKSSGNNTCFSYIKKFKNFIPNFCRDILWATHKWGNKNLNDWSCEFSPDAVFLVAGKSPY